MFEKLKYKCEMAFSYQLVILYIKKKQEYIDFKLKNYDMKSKNKCYINNIKLLKI